MNISKSEPVAGYPPQSAADNDYAPTRFKLPKDSGAKGVLAKLIALNFEDAEIVRVRVFDEDIWSPHENLSTFQLFLKGCGIESSKPETWNFEFRGSEFDVLFGLLSLSLHFIWSIVVYSEQGPRLRIMASHDEWIAVTECEDALLGEILSLFAEYQEV
jgi:hypothetical protein